MTLEQLANLESPPGTLADFEAMRLRVLSIREKSLGPDHPLVGITLSNLGAFYQGHGQPEKAEPVLQRAQAIQERGSGMDHPTTSSK
jgi:hypothetical protein